ALRRESCLAATYIHKNRGHFSPRSCWQECLCHQRQEKSGGVMIPSSGVRIDPATIPPFRGPTRHDSAQEKNRAAPVPSTRLRAGGMTAGRRAARLPPMAGEQKTNPTKEGETQEHRQECLCHKSRNTSHKSRSTSHETF